jgi:hypothetical protein
MRLAELLLAVALVPGVAAAQTPESRDGPLGEDEFQVLATGGETLMPCVGQYMSGHPLDEAVGSRLIELGLGGELKARAMGAISPASGDYASLRSLDPNKPADVANMLALLAQDLSASADAIDRRPNVLGLAVFNYFLARLAGDACVIDPALTQALPRARYDRLTQMPELGFDGLKLQREVDQAALCAFGHMPPKDREGDNVNGYLAEHGDLVQMRADAEAFAASLDEEQKAVATAYLAALPEGSSAADQAGRYMGLLVGSERGDRLPPATRYRAAALSSYHLARATGGSCKLGPAALQLIGKEN